MQRERMQATKYILPVEGLAKRSQSFNEMAKSADSNVSIYEGMTSLADIEAFVNGGHGLVIALLDLMQIPYLKRPNLNQAFQGHYVLIYWIDSVRKVAHVVDCCPLDDQPFAASAA